MSTNHALRTLAWLFAASLASCGGDTQGIESAVPGPPQGLGSSPGVTTPSPPVSAPSPAPPPSPAPLPSPTPVPVPLPPPASASSIPAPGCSPLPCVQTVTMAAPDTVVVVVQTGPHEASGPVSVVDQTPASWSVDGVTPQAVYRNSIPYDEGMWRHDPTIDDNVFPRVLAPQDVLAVANSPG